MPSASATAEHSTAAASANPMHRSSSAPRSRSPPPTTQASCSDGLRTGEGRGPNVLLDAPLDRGVEGQLRHRSRGGGDEGEREHGHHAEVDRGEHTGGDCRGEQHCGEPRRRRLSRRALRSGCRRTLPAPMPRASSPRQMVADRPPIGCTRTTKAPNSSSKPDSHRSAAAVRSAAWIVAAHPAGRTVTCGAARLLRRRRPHGVAAETRSPRRRRRPQRRARARCDGRAS